MKYGDFIKHHRLRSGFKTQKRFADATGLSTATISRIEDNKHRPLPETIEAIANHLPSTSYRELMAVCGYPKPDAKERIDNFQNERELLDKIDLSDEELLKQFEIAIDGRVLSEEEAKSIIAFVRVRRQMNGQQE